MNVITSPFLVFTRRWLAGWLAPFLSSYNIGLLSSFCRLLILSILARAAVSFPGATRAKGIVSVQEASSVQHWDMTSVVASLDNMAAPWSLLPSCLSQYRQTWGQSDPMRVFEEETGKWRSPPEAEPMRDKLLISVMINLSISFFHFWKLHLVLFHVLLMISDSVLSPACLCDSILYFIKPFRT